MTAPRTACSPTVRRPGRRLEKVKLRRLLLGGLVPFFAGLGCTGCRTTPFSLPTAPRGELPVSTACRVDDVPVPAPFSPDAARSFGSESPLIAHHVYRAFQVDPDLVERFYRKQMPVARWEPMGRVEAGGRRMLLFGRGAERCLIHIERDRFLRTVLTIEVVGG